MSVSSEVPDDREKAHDAVKDGDAISQMESMARHIPKQE